MIPKVINFCWFGKNKYSKVIDRCIKSWQREMPDFEIKKWTEDNFDITQNEYCRQAYERKKWAFVSDYARLKIIFDNGGIYLDTDVEIIRPLSPLVSNGVGFLGFQNSEEANTGLGFAAAPHNNVVGEMLKVYEKRQFIKNNFECNEIPCPAANTIALMNCGLRTGLIYSKRIQSLDGIKVYPVDYFNPMDYDTGNLNITDNTYTIHRYQASWVGKNKIIKRVVKSVVPKFFWEWRTIKLARNHMQQLQKEIG